MKYATATYGDVHEKDLPDGRQIIIPFVGTDRLGPTAVLGVGLMRQVNGEIFVVGGVSCQLIRSWRAYQLLTHVPRIPHLLQTLSACWEVTEPEQRLENNEHFNHLAGLFGGVMIVQHARTEVPPVYELEDMVEKLREGHIYVDPREFEVEVEAGRLANTPRLQKLIARLHHDRPFHRQNHLSTPAVDTAL